MLAPVADQAAQPVLVTGGAGFIGSHLCESLLALGREVYALDDLSTGARQNISHLLNHPRFHFVCGSILDESRMGALVDRCEEVFHLAAAVGVKLIFDRPVHTIETNVRGTEVVLQASLKRRRKVLLTSTSEVYGRDVNGGSTRFSEDHDLALGPSIRWAYACSKALDEYLARAYHKELGLPSIVVRLFNTVGPRQTGAYGMVIPRLVACALAGEPLTVYGDGSQVRCFSWVGDVVGALIRLMAEPGAVGETLNLGNDRPITIGELAERIKRKTASASPIVRVSYEAAYGAGFEDVRYRVPDIRKVAELIGFKPTKDIDDILDEVIRAQTTNE